MTNWAQKWKKAGKKVYASELFHTLILSVCTYLLDLHLFKSILIRCIFPHLFFGQIAKWVYLCSGKPDKTVCNDEKELHSKMVCRDDALPESSTMRYGIGIVSAGLR